MAVFTVTKQDILIAAGLDAVITLKTIELGVQMFAPIAIVGLVICALLSLRLSVEKSRNRSCTQCFQSGREDRLAV